VIKDRDINTAYVDAGFGASGDMLVGAFIDAGVPLDYLIDNLKLLPVDGYTLSAKHVTRCGMKAVKFDVDTHDSGADCHAPGRTFGSVRAIIDGSGLSGRVKAAGLKVFRALFNAEARVHGVSFDNAHLHELAAVDCIVDIIGFCLALDYFNIAIEFEEIDSGEIDSERSNSGTSDSAPMPVSHGRLHASAVNIGGGFIETAHGTLPVPAPATAELLKNIPVFSTGLKFETITPTGAALLKETVHAFGPMPRMTIKTIGIGAGARDFKTHPNVVRVFLGNAGDNNNDANGGSATASDGGAATASNSGAATASNGGETTASNGGETVTVIECNIDDMSPQLYDGAMEKLFAAGALDVTLTPVIMKKGRPGITLSVIAETDKLRALSDIIFTETTTIGLRYYEARRDTLAREVNTVETPYGPIRVKTAYRGDNAVNAAPEYEDLKDAASRHGVSIKKVAAETMGRWSDDARGPVNRKPNI
jgi:hypothetical protein